MIDWIAGAVELTGLWCVGNKWKIGFLINIIGNIAWIYVAFSTQIYGLLLVVIPAIVLNIRNYLRWRKQGRMAESGIATVSKTDATV